MNREFDCTLGVKLLNEDAVVPQYAHDSDSGMDLFTTEEVIIPPHKAVAIPTGIAFDIPMNYEIQIRPRSGISLNGCKDCLIQFEDEEYYLYNGNDFRINHVKKLKQQNCYITVRLGTVDEGYKGEVKIIVYNEEDFDVLVPKGTKLAQAVLAKVAKPNIQIVNDLSDSERGNKGFGSTGAN